MRSDDCTIPTQDVYKKYLVWAKEKEIHVQVKDAFASAVRRHMYNKETSKGVEIIRVGRDQEKTFKHLAWKEEPVDVFQREQAVLNDVDFKEAIKPHEKLKELRQFVIRNRNAGYSITWKMLLSAFSETELNHFVQDGYLKKQVGDSYTI